MNQMPKNFTSATPRLHAHLRSADLVSPTPSKHPNFQIFRPSPQPAKTQSTATSERWLPTVASAAAQPLQQLPSRESGQPQAATAATYKMQTAVDGPPDKPLLLFIHGYPDDESMWEPQVAHFKDRYYCVRVTLPNFGGTIDSQWGFDFGEIVGQIKAALDGLGAGGREVVLVTHDFGCIFGYLFEQTWPNLVTKMVSLDVGISEKQQPNRLGYIMIPFYRLNFALAFLFTQIPAVGMALGGVWTKLTFTMLQKIAEQYTLPGVELAGPSRQTQISPSMNYLYYHLLKAGSLKIPIAEYRPKCPVLYVYGGSGIKGFMQFHDPKWLEMVEQQPQGKVVSFKNAGHWVMKDKPRELHQLMDEFLADVQ